MPNTHLDYSVVMTEPRNCPMAKGDYNTSNGHEKTKDKIVWDEKGENGVKQSESLS